MDRREFNRAMGAAGRETGYGHAPPDEARRASWLERNVGIPTSAQGLGDFNRGLDRADQQITNDFIDVAKNSFSGRPGPAHTEDGRKLVGGPVLPWMLTPTGTAGGAANLARNLSASGPAIRTAASRAADYAKYGPHMTGVIGPAVHTVNRWGNRIPSIFGTGGFSSSGEKVVGSGDKWGGVYNAGRKLASVAESGKLPGWGPSAFRAAKSAVGFEQPTSDEEQMQLAENSKVRSNIDKSRAVRKRLRVGATPRQRELADPRGAGGMLLPVRGDMPTSRELRENMMA